jgi:hypothetical protein
LQVARHYMTLLLGTWIWLRVRGVTGVIRNASEGRFWPVVIESVTFARLSCVHLTLGSLLGELLSIVAPCTGRAHVRGGRSRHQTAVRTVARMRCARRIGFCCKCPA